MAALPLRSAPTAPVHADRGWIHVVPSVALLVLCGMYPLVVLVTTFQAADADISTRPAAKGAAAAAAFVAVIAGLLIGSFVTMVAYSAVRFGRTPGVRTAQMIGLGLTTLGCCIGMWLALVVVPQMA